MHRSEPSAVGQQARVRHYARECDTLSVFNLLTGPRLLEQVEALLPDHRERLLPPTETLAMFIDQALSRDGSCQEAVNAFQVRRLREGLTPGSTDTGAYCKARSRLPLEMVSGLVRTCGVQLSAQAPVRWRWQARRVLLVDRSVLILPDTEANQAGYPQPHSQQPGCWAFRFCAWSH